jgi:DNA-binding transcriptional MerR regulator
VIAMPELLETGRAARLLGISPFRVRQLADAGTLPVALRTAGGERLFDPAAVEQLRRERERTRRVRVQKAGQPATAGR